MPVADGSILGGQSNPLATGQFELLNSPSTTKILEIRMLKPLLFILSAGALLIGSVWAGSQEEIPKQDRVARRDYMRTKLNFSQAIVEGLAMKNFDTINTAATEIRNVTEGELWMVHNTADYNRYSDELKAAAEELIKAAEAKNLEGCTLRYFDMTLKCIDCHEYLRRNRL